MKYYYSILLAFALITSSHSQHLSDTDQLFRQLDSLQGYTNLEIINGTANRERYRTINEKHSYFDDRNFQSGTLVYDDEKFTKIDLRYDMFGDILMANIRNSKTETFLIELIKDLVKSFEIDGHKFENIIKAEKNYGFHEVLYDYGCIKIFRKQNFKPLEKRDRAVKYYEFENLKNTYFLDTEDRFIEIRLSNLKEVFPTNTSNIQAYFKENNTLRRKNYEEFLKGLAVLVQEFECQEN